MEDPKVLVFAVELSFLEQGSAETRQLANVFLKQPADALLALIEDGLQSRHLNYRLRVMGAGEHRVGEMRGIEKAIENATEHDHVSQQVEDAAHEPGKDFSN